MWERGAERRTMLLSNSAVPFIYSNPFSFIIRKCTEPINHTETNNCAV